MNDEFYNSKPWRKLSQRILKKQHYECQVCKKEGKHTKADLVHHVHFVNDRPDLKLSEYDENGELNLIAICKPCHNTIHFGSKEKPLTIERW